MTELSFLEELFLELSKALLTLALEGFSITSLPPIQSPGYLKALANHTISTRDYHGSPLQPTASCTTPERISSSVQHCPVIHSLNAFSLHQHWLSLKRELIQLHYALRSL